MQHKREEVRLSIDTDGGPISMVQLSDFILSFRAAYVVALECMIEHPEAGMWASVDDLASFVRERARSRPASPIGMFGLGRRHLAPDFDIELVDLRRENPLEWAVIGISTALTAAVILSGGEIKLPGFRAKLPPLGTGIEALRKSLRGREPKRISAKKPRTLKTGPKKRGDNQ